MKAKITKTHDWMRLKITDDDGKSVSLTWSRYKDSATARGIEDRALLSRLVSQWSQIRDTAKGVLPMDDAAKVAEAASDFESLDFSSVMNSNTPLPT